MIPTNDLIPNESNKRPHECYLGFEHEFFALLSYMLLIVFPRTVCPK